MISQIVPADPSLPIRTVEPSKTNSTKGKNFDLEELQAIVGGFIEHVRYLGSGHIWLNEEGKLNLLDTNQRATDAAHFAKAIAADDFIVGNVLIQTPKGKAALK